MTTQTVILLLIIGLLSGMLSGMVGIGGGIIIVPALIYVLGFSQHEAQGTSLGLLLLPAGILAAWNYYKKGYIDIRDVLIMAAAFIIGGYFGSKLAVVLPDATLKKGFAILLVAVACKMLFLDK